MRLLLMKKLVVLFVLVVLSITANAQTICDDIKVVLPGAVKKGVDKQGIKLTAVKVHAISKVLLTNKEYKVVSFKLGMNYGGEYREFFIAGNIIKGEAKVLLNKTGRGNKVFFDVIKIGKAGSTTATCIISPFYIEII
jgi:hypothetical protein